MEGLRARVLGVEWWRLTGSEVLSRLQELERLSREIHAEMLAGIAEADAQDLPKELGYRNTVELLRDALGITRTEAKRRLRHAGLVVDVRTVSGALVAAVLPLAGAALRRGAVGVDHVAAIGDAVDALPAWVTPEERTEAERILVRAAETTDAHAVTRLGREILARVDQDGPAPPEESLAQPHNELHVLVRRSGRVALRGELDPESGSLLVAVLSPLTKPRPIEGQPDPRNAAERRGDALAEILHLAADTATLPTEAGEKPHVTVTMTLDALTEGIGGAVLGQHTPITASQARRLACDAKIIPAVLGTRSEPLDVGRTTRTVPPAMRRALVLRDGGCAFPGCDRPPNWTDAHHVRPWSQGGATVLGNLVLLCRLHHGLLHHSDWRADITDGQPRFIPPRWLDPLQRPRTRTPPAA